MEQQIEKKGKLAMFEKNVLTLVISMILLGAAMTAVPVPVLWAIGCLSFLALSVAMRPQHQG
jgi:hypothetical protein